MPTKTQSEALRECQNRILVAAPVITDALIEQAKKGNYQHAKFLFDLAFPPAPKSAPKDGDEEELPGPSLAETLLERLDHLLEEDPVPAANELECDA